MGRSAVLARLARDCGARGRAVPGRRFVLGAGTTAPCCVREPERGAGGDLPTGGSVRCIICKRSLRDAESVRLGVGPVCRKKGRPGLAREQLSFLEHFTNAATSTPPQFWMFPWTL